MFTALFLFLQVFHFSDSFGGVLPPVVEKKHPVAFGMSVLQSTPRFLFAALQGREEPASEAPIRYQGGLDGEVWSRVLEEARQIDSLQAKLDYINASVNNRVRYVLDSIAAGSEDHASSAASTALRGIGDCEDYAILKYELLARAGVAREAMFLLVGVQLLRPGGHAVLLVRDGVFDYWLDNQNLFGTNRAIRFSEAQPFSTLDPMYALNEMGLWVYARRIGQ